MRPSKRSHTTEKRATLVFASLDQLQLCLWQRRLSHQGDDPVPHLPTMPILALFRHKRQGHLCRYLVIKGQGKDGGLAFPGCVTHVAGADTDVASNYSCLVSASLDSRQKAQALGTTHLIGPGVLQEWLSMGVGHHEIPPM